MSKHFTSCRSEAATQPLQSAFLALLPTIESVARVYIRHIRCPDQEEDFVCEVIAVAWSWHVRLAERGRDPAAFVVTLTRQAVRRVGSGRRLCGQEPIRDVMSRTCQQRHGHQVGTLPDGPVWPTVLEDALADNTQSPVPVQAQFRGDFADWMQRLPARKRRLLRQLAIGERTQDVAQSFGVSSARITQMRGELRRDYLHFLSSPAVK